MSTRDNEDYSKIIGWLSGLLISRIKIDPEVSFRDLLLICKNTIIEAMNHILLPQYLFRAVDHEKWSRFTALFGDDLVAAQLNIEEESMEKSIMDFTPCHFVAMICRSSDINFGVNILKNGLIVNCRYKTNAISPSEIAGICENFIGVLRAAIQFPDIKMEYWAKPKPLK